MDKPEPLSISDAESIQNAIMQLALKYPEYPETFEPSYGNVKWNSINTNASIGLYALPGAVYLKKYVCGGYRAQFNFAIRYRSSPQSPQASISSQLMLENMAKWMEKCRIYFTGQNITIESIARTSQVYSPTQDETSQDCAVDMRVVFEQEE